MASNGKPMSKPLNAIIKSLPLMAKFFKKKLSLSSASSLFIFPTNHSAVLIRPCSVEKAGVQPRTLIAFDESIRKSEQSRRTVDC